MPWLSMSVDSGPDWAYQYVAGLCACSDLWEIDFMPGCYPMAHLGIWDDDVIILKTRLFVYIFLHIMDLYESVLTPACLPIWI